MAYLRGEELYGTVQATQTNPNTRNRFKTENALGFKLEKNLVSLRGAYSNVKETFLDVFASLKVERQPKKTDKASTCAFFDDADKNAGTFTTLSH